MRRTACLILVLLLASPYAFAMRCGSRLASEGDQDFQVRDRCGDPFWTDRYTNVEIIGAHGPVEEQREVQFDIWYYNFGPRQLMRKLVFRDGRLLREDTLGYGVNEIGDDCNRILGDLSAGELVARCGEPMSRRSQTDTLVRRPARGIEQWSDRRREDWIYDIGDREYVRIVRLVDGRVTGVERVRR
ncbi:MAG: DUF2845 domain-containing protein [Dokdonella sp.]